MVKQKIDIYRSAIAGCTEPIGKYVHDQASTFTMALCAPTLEEARETARESFEWYPKAGARLIASVAEMQAERGEELGTYSYAADLKNVADDGSLDFMDLEYLETSGACVLGTPDQCIATCRRYEEAGVDQLLCLVNPYKIPHAKVMQTIQMMGEHVLPEFR
jgi:alkanesulfonate monooxygenase SsuD/methylene tetrahydromethanopterin reductase-like flavin-dependent oxidoreductase (luciferase family)